MKKFLRHIRYLISQGDTEQALKALVKKRLPRKLRNEFTLLSHRFHTAKQAFDRGIISFEDFTVFSNRIANTLLSQVTNGKQEMLTWWAIKKIVFGISMTDLKEIKR